MISHCVENAVLPQRGAVAAGCAALHALPARKQQPHTLVRSGLPQGLLSPINKPGVTQQNRQRMACPVSSAAAQPQQQQSSSGLRGLYPATTPHTSGYLQVSNLHKVYYEVHGNPQGIPAVVVHGGPGAGCYANHARFFDASTYRIVLLDQRGCGRSTPSGCLAENTTADLVSDLETLRKTLGVHSWLLLGGSWGVALSVAYAQAHPDRVLGLILRGVCLMRPSELQWMYGGGAAALKPLAWGRFAGNCPARERGNPLLSYYKRMLSSDAAERQAAAKAWMGWEMSVGFSNNQDLWVWDGQQWQNQPAPATQQQAVQLPSAPRPASTAAAEAAAAAAEAAGFPALQRGASVPAEVLAGSFSNHESSSNNSSTCTTIPTATTVAAGPSGPAAAAEISSSNNVNNSSISSATVLPLDNTRRPPPAAAAAATPQPDWVWGLPAQGANIQDPEVQQLIWQGLNHQGVAQGAAQALLECHYSVHGAFLLEQPLLEHVQRIRHIPCIAVQGQMDFVCPPTTAVDLSNAWPEMELRLVPGAGHSMYDPPITHELVCATDRMRALQQQRPAAIAAGSSCQHLRR
uniref:prolyl aminopeptidase n=1 Tax=Tetradesmus obliquus TaxID=3088 RepID=A0A383VL06_TETOB|eukprot:jgi/Sobl393_1/4223/SZX65613.1